MSRFHNIVRDRVGMRSASKDFTFIYEPSQSFPSAFIDEKHLVYDMSGKQLGSVSDEGYFCNLFDFGNPVAFYDDSYDVICDNSGNMVGCVSSNKYFPYFNVAKPSFTFDKNCCRVYNTTIPTSRCARSFTGNVSNKKFINLF